MPKYEVHIPATATTGFNFTFRVDADNWMAALKVGMLKLGEQGSHGQNVLVDIQDDNALHVTEPESGRVFQIRELSEQEAAAAPVKKATGPRPAAAGKGMPVSLAEERPEAKTLPGEPITAALQKEIDAYAARTDAAKAAKQEAAAAAARKASTPAPAPADDEDPWDDKTAKAEPERAKPAPAVEPARAEPRLSESRGGNVARPVEPPRGGDGRSQETVATRSMPRNPAHQTTGSGKRQPSKIELATASMVELERPTRPVSGPIGRVKEKRSQQPADIDSALADVFERVQDVHGKTSPEEALYFLLDLALEKIPADSGTVFQADAGSGDLTFAAVRGPKANDLLRANLVIPSGTGIVGFCATEGVSVALSDVEKDPRHYAEVGIKVNYETRSVLCSPMMTHGRSFGCIQLLNKKGSAQFGEHEIGLLAYLAHQAALYLNART